MARAIGQTEENKNTSHQYQSTVPDTLQWMEEIHLEYILGASADAHMEACPPSNKKNGRQGYIALFAIFLSPPCYRNSDSLEKVAGRRRKSEEKAVIMPILFYTSPRSNRLKTSGGTVGMYLRARSRFVPPNPAP
jgi:hypothetical protein